MGIDQNLYLLLDIMFRAADAILQHILEYSILFGVYVDHRTFPCIQSSCPIFLRVSPSVDQTDTTSANVPVCQSLASFSSFLAVVTLCR